MMILRLLCCAASLCFASGCGVLVQKALEGGGYGESCEVQDDCKDEFVCVRAAPVDPGQRPVLGYRCLQPCQSAGACTESVYHQACCRMTFQDQAMNACFEDTSEFCAQVVSSD